jgi:hypothetical protein
MRRGSFERGVGALIGSCQNSGLKLSKGIAKGSLEVPNELLCALVFESGEASEYSGQLRQSLLRASLADAFRYLGTLTLQ